MESNRISGQSYYEIMPSADIRAGDIWKGMPTFGHLRLESCSGIIITPACDLSNHKVETVTYLPIVPVANYMMGRNFAVEMARVVRAQATAAALASAEYWQLRGIHLPTKEGMERTRSEADLMLSSGCSDKQKLTIARVKAAIEVIQASRGLNVDAGTRKIRLAMGDKEYEKCISDIIKNSYSTDIHFLPADGRSGDLSVMLEHSVVLFRYPMSLPVEILEAANDITISDWCTAVNTLEVEFPIVRCMRHTRPMKLGALRSRFLPDLVARFAGLHIRMGSPDFTRETIDSFVQELG